MDHGISRAADGAVDHDGVFKRVAREDLRQFQVFTHHVDDAPARQLRLQLAARIDGGNGRVAGQGHAQRPRTMLAMVEAVPMVMQWPAERDMHASACLNSFEVMRPARTSSENFHTSVPEPIGLPR